MNDRLKTAVADERSTRLAQSSAYSSAAGDPGLTVRQLFAAMAMQGLLSNLTAIRKEGFKDSQISEFAVMNADALIAELSK